MNTDEIIKRAKEIKKNGGRGPIDVKLSNDPDEWFNKTLRQSQELIDTLNSNSVIILV